MKNRTIIGIICIVVALVLSFAIAPLVNKFADSRVDIVRITRDITQGHKLTADDIEIVTIGSFGMPADVITDKEAVIGKYAACDLKKTDFLLPSKISDNADSAADVFMNLDGSQVAMSITIPSFAGGLSGKLTNGDIVRLIAYTDADGDNVAVVPEALQYVRVITSTTAAGLDKDELIQNEDGTYELPTTVTLLVNPLQATLLTEYENNSKLHAVLVSRGNEKQATKMLAEQAVILERLAEEAAKEAENAESEETVSEDEVIVHG